VTRLIKYSLLTGRGSGRAVLRGLSLALVLAAVVLPAGCSPKHEGGKGVAGRASKAPTRYTCPMHPSYIADKPGSCPICGMDLVPVADAPSITPDAAVTDMSPVQVSETGARLAGIQTAPAVLETITRSIRAVALVEPDEALIRHVQTKVAGWVEKLYVNSTGQAVRRGEPILSIYSPELLAAQQELLSAKTASLGLAGSSSADVRGGGEALVAAAEQRLRLLDVPDDFVEQLERTGTPSRVVTMIAPASGLVTAKEVFEGQQISPGSELFTVTDLSRIWVEASFYEYEAGAIRTGQAAELTLPYDPGTWLQGHVDLIYPSVNPESRTLRVRLAFPNPDLKLKPGMFANVNLETESAESVVIPDDAVMDTGERQLVFVETGTGHFEPRQVTAGIRSQGKAQILSGLTAGERVVVRANFLLDSESRLRAAQSLSGRAGPSPGGMDGMPGMEGTAPSDGDQTPLGGRK
jgi:membrane fusion protein, copper/silver efflux system